MNFPSDRFELVLAQRGDWPDIKRIYDSGEFDGGIAVQYLRDPDPIASFEREGDKAVILMLRDRRTNKAAGFGACIIKKVFKDGKIVNMGYLTGLKLLPEYRKKVFFISYAYQKLYEYTKDYVDFYFSTILKENTAVQKMLEKPRKQMPLYEYLGDYRVYFCKSGIRSFWSEKFVFKAFGNGGSWIKALGNGKSGASVFGSGRNRCGCSKSGAKYVVGRCSREEAEAFYARHARETDLSLESVSVYDLKNAVFYGLYEDNALAACGYVLNQQHYKQYVVKKYSGIYKLISRLPMRLLGYPSFPRINEAANCACAGLWAENDDGVLARRLWQFMRQDAREFDFIMIGLHESHPLRSYFDKIRHIKYDSRCYIVDFEHDKEAYESLYGKKLYIDVAFL